MLQITPQMKFYIAIDPIDFRKGIDGLVSVCKLKLNEDPFTGKVFIFCNNFKTSIKILVYDGQGFWLLQKRLSKGKFKWWPTNKTNSNYNKIVASELQILLWNGNPEKASIPKDWKQLS